MVKFGGKFTAPVYPGETYKIELWKEGNTIIYRTSVKERNKVALTGYAELRGDAKL